VARQSSARLKVQMTTAVARRGRVAPTDQRTRSTVRPAVVVWNSSQSAPPSTNLSTATGSVTVSACASSTRCPATVRGWPSGSEAITRSIPEPLTTAVTSTRVTDVQRCQYEAGNLPK
jgi:hypothetical protein